MFGLIISGRPVDAAPQAVNETQCVFKISPIPTFSHIVVFLLPGVQLPPGTAATVFVQIPPSQEPKLLGGIGPGKESAIFKVSGLKSGPGSGSAGDAMADDLAAASGDIVVGISVEPVANVEQQLATLKSGGQPIHETSNALVRLGDKANAGVTTKVLAQRIIQNAFNFLSSFGSDTVPLKAFENWWKKFESKIDLDPSFLEREP